LLGASSSGLSSGDGKLPPANQRTIEPTDLRDRLSLLLLSVDVGLDRAANVTFELIQWIAGSEAAGQLKDFGPVAAYSRIFFFVDDDSKCLQLVPHSKYRNNSSGVRSPI
jgi:hypothetical protein